MLEGEWKTATIAQSGTTSGEVNLGRVYEKMVAIIPAVDTAQISFTVAQATGGTFQNLHITDPADGGDNRVISASRATAFTWVVPIGGVQFIKVVASASQTSAARTIYLMGVRS
jgi:hypothetical protein